MTKHTKRIKVKSVCYKCKKFNKNQRQQYKCAVPASCPGINWSDKRKESYIRNHQNKTTHREQLSKLKRRNKNEI